MPPRESSCLAKSIVSREKGGAYWQSSFSSCDVDNGMLSSLVSTPTLVAEAELNKTS